MPDKKISELESTVSFDGATDILPIVDTSADVTKKITINNLLQGQVSSVSLGTNAPRTDGYTADEGSIGEALDGSRWIKVGNTDTDWEQIFLTESGTFSANIQVAESSGIVLPANVLGSNEGFITIGDGETVGGKKVRTEDKALMPTYHFEDGYSGIFMQNLSDSMLNEHIKARYNVGSKLYAQTLRPENPAFLPALEISGSVTETVYYYPWTPYWCRAEGAQFTFSSVEAVIFDSNIEEIEASFAGLAFSFKYANFPEGLKLIGRKAFSDASNFREPFYAPSTLQIIGEDAFKNANMTLADLNSGLNVVDSGAFENSDLASLDLGETVQLIGANAFKDNDIVGDLAIPDSLALTPVPSGTGIVAARSGIEDGAFENNTSLGNVYANIDAAFFNSGALTNAGTGSIYVTSGHIASYGGASASWGSKTVAEWTNYPTIPN